MRKKVLYTCIARCGVCKRELNRAMHVPEEDKSRVAVSAPLFALCPERQHNTLSDLNLKVELEWLSESESCEQGQERQ